MQSTFLGKKLGVIQMKKISLVATDMDGTLLNNEQGISVNNAKAIRGLVKKSIPVILASGRSFASVRKFSLEVGINCPIICAMVHAL